jgi:hypothetical protein
LWLRHPDNKLSGPPAINHPNARGMKLFADSLMGLFPAKGD